MGSDYINLVDSNLREQELDDEERLLRDLFAQEYLQDYSPYGAALRVGFDSAFASDYAKKFMSEGYVRRKINELESKIATEDEQAISRSKVERLLFREANYFGHGSSHGARVSALSKLAVIYGMDKEPEPNGDGLPKGGVMVVPMMVSPDEWGKQAEESQSRLKDSVKD